MEWFVENKYNNDDHKWYKWYLKSKYVLNLMIEKCFFKFIKGHMPLALCMLQRIYVFNNKC